MTAALNQIRDALKLPWIGKGNSELWDTPSHHTAAICGTAPMFDASGEVVAFAVNVGWGTEDAKRRDYILRAVNCHADMLAALKKASQLADIATDWNLDEVEIDGEMVRTYDLRDEFDAAIAKATAAEGK